MIDRRIVAGLGTAALLGSLVAGIASAQQYPAPYNPPGFERGQGGSNRNLYRVERSLESSIDQMQNDQHDYDGHRVAAIADLRRAVGEIRAAERFARDHGY